LIVLLLATAAAQPALADAFGRPDDGAALPAVSHSAIAVPRPVQTVFAGILAAQRALNGELRAELSQVRTGQSWRPAAMIVAISFLYGVLHAIGPGHGKFVIGGYFLTRRARIIHGLAMSGTAAMVQALSAIVWVGGLVVLLRISAAQVLSHAAAVEMTSYALIALLGLSMLWNVATRRACCAHGDDPGHDHHHDHHHDHDHDQPATGAREWVRILGIAAAVGLRPCSGAILVLLFTLANAIFPVGILATLAMGLGVAITVSLVSLTTLGARRLAPALAGAGGAARERLSRIFAYGGAVLITAFGLLQVFALWSGLVTPAFG
jgi:ABC-type nickel/cobalt efflux system permease component RcnA